MITAEKAIEAIKEKITSLGLITHYDQFYPWKKSMIGTLKRIVPNNEAIIEHLEEIESTSMYGGDYTKSAKRDSQQILESLIKDIERFGLEELKDNNNDSGVVKVNVHQNNEQTQTTKVQVKIDLIVDVLKGELRASEIEQLKEILESSDEPKEKKKKFMDKIKSFGSDVASNILANILTNPQVYEQIGGML